MEQRGIDLGVWVFVGRAFGRTLRIPFGLLLLNDLHYFDCQPPSSPSQLS